MTLRELQRLVKDLHGKSAQAVDQALRDQRLDPTERIAVKREMAATAHQRLHARGEMAHDHAEWRPDRPMAPQSEVERLLTKIGVDLSGYKGYTEPEMDALLQQAGIADPTQRIALKFEAESRGLLRPPRQAQESRRIEAMRASAERPAGQVLRNADGTPRTLRGS
jgi:hypothetical protein